jgi:hypothetical protein
MQVRLDTKSIFEDGPTPVAGMLDRRGVYRSDVSIYRCGLVVDSTMMSTWEGVPVKHYPADVDVDRRTAVPNLVVVL